MSRASLTLEQLNWKIVTAPDIDTYDRELEIEERRSYIGCYIHLGVKVTVRFVVLSSDAFDFLHDICNWKLRRLEVMTVSSPWLKGSPPHHGTA